MDIKEPDSTMVVDFDGKQIDVDIYVDPAFKSVRYELTCNEEINPTEAAGILLKIVEHICLEAGIDPDSFVMDEVMDEDGSISPVKKKLH